MLSFRFGHRSTRRGALVSALLFGLGGACVQQARPPQVAPSGTLAPAGEAARADGEDGAFRVVFATPRGEAAEVGEISVVFSRPLRSLELAGESQAPAIAIQPALPGRWHWVGTRALRFVPEGPRLPGATRVSVAVPESVRALDGSRLDEPYRFEFSTPRPKLVESEPYAGQEGLVPSAAFELRFNQAIDPEAFQKAARLAAERAGRRQSLRFRVRRPDPSEPKRLELRPLAPLPIDSAIELAISAELRSEEGPLPAGSATTLGFRTFGPLRISDVSCQRDTPHGRCLPGGAISLLVSNPVKFGDLKRALGVTPALPLRWESFQDDASLTSSIDLVGPFQAGKTYTLQVAPELTDRFGQKLGRAFSRAVAIDDHFPRVEIGVRGSALVAGGPRSIPVASVNVPRFELLAAELDPERILALYEGRREQFALAVFDQLRGAARRTISPAGAPNQLSKTFVDVAEILGGPRERGPLAIGVRYDGDPRDYYAPETVKVVKLTDLGLTAKLSREGSLVWVTRLSTSEAVSGAEVSLLRKGLPLRSYRTDAQGLARIPARDFTPDFYGAEDPGVLFVRAGADSTFEPVRSFLAPWRLRVPVELAGRDAAYGLLFSDRGIYRPGDSVELKGIVREPTRAGNALPRAREAELAFHAPDGEKIGERRVPLTRFGTFSTTFRLPGSVSLGSFRVEARLRDGGVLSESFEVAEYRPAEFKVDVTSARPAYVRGDEARFTVQGQYLFGAPLGGAAVRYAALRAESRFAVPGADDFVTDASALHADLDERALAAGELVAADGKLDADGRLDVARKLDLAGQRGAEVVTVDAEVTDAARQAIAGSVTALVHPAEFYVGIRQPKDYFVSAPGKFSPAVVALAPSGQRLSGKKLSLELVSRRWTLAHEDRGGRSSAVSEVVDRVVARCELETRAEPVSCPLQLSEAGYHLVHVRGRDGRKNGTAAALGIYAIGQGAASFADNDRRELELVANKKSYAVGETAKILVKSPFVEAEALVTIERGGVLRAERVRLRGPTPTVDVRVTDEFRPNAFVGVHLLKVTAGKKPSAPEFRTGYAEIGVDPEARRLTVALQPSRRELRPGDELTVDLEVRDRTGGPALAEVTLYAVDEGVLSLVGYRTPDPLPVFTGPRPLGVATVETRDSLARILLETLDGSLGADKGRDGGGGGALGARRDFRQTAYYNAGLVTNEKGRARARFKLPDGLTTYRLMAVAASPDDRYGFGVARVTTSKKLMARPALPRFLRAGDRLQASVIVSAKGFGPEKVVVTASTRGGLVLDAGKSQVLELGKDESREVRFSSRADRAGPAAIRFDVQAGGERDAVEIERAIAAPTALETVAFYGATTTPAAQRLGDLRDLRSDVGGLEVSLASTALVGLDAGLTRLLEYPYGCTEQLASRLVPLLALRELARDFKVELGHDQLVIERTVAEILARQRSDGGFGMWPEARESSPWVAPYAVWALHWAAVRGVGVPALALGRAKDHLRRELARLDFKNGLSLASGAFIVDVLAEIGAPDPGYMARLFEARKDLPVFSKAQLLHAFAVSKLGARSAQRLVSELEGQLRISGNTAAVAENTGDEYAVLMDSPARSAALVLRGLLAANRNHPLADELARGLLAARRGGAWRTTQENAFALLALDAYRKTREAVAPDFSARVWLNDTQIASADFRGRTLRAERTTLASERSAGLSGADLVFERSGSGTLFYEARLRYAKKTLPATPLDQGFFVQKSLRTVRPEELECALGSVTVSDQSRFAAGDLVLADLLVVAPSPRDFVALDDPLPAGFEAVDSGLVSTASWLRVPQANEDFASDCFDCDEQARDDLAHGRARLSSVARRELRDDRVLFFVDHMAAGLYHYRYLARATSVGSFVVPPARVEEMYTPENFGRTAGALVVVQ